VEQLEQSLDALNADLPPLKDFILPGGNLEAAHCHLARTISRRAERRVATLARQERLNPQGLRYLNWLSDLLLLLGSRLVFCQPLPFHDSADAGVM
jgi:cob(I)alamin adenosyltransferase